MGRIATDVSGDSVSDISDCNDYNAAYRSTSATGLSNNISAGPIGSGQAMCDERVLNN